MDTSTDTIFALASGALPSGVAVVRLSGPAVRFVLETMAGGCPPPRRASLRKLGMRGGQVLDEGLVLWFPAPASFTGEDMAELHLHGGRAVVAAVAAALVALPGLRPADAGEFTRRAFLAGRLDLTETEGLADLLAAETEAQRRQAVGQAGGALKRLYEGWRERIVTLRALVEAELDFVDEADVPGSVADRTLAEAPDLAREIARHLDDGGRGERLRVGFTVVLMGPPNAGKSSLLNALARRDAAIVTAEPGTTRDLIEVQLDLDGYPVTLVDAAGLRETAGLVEREGIRRALERAEAADLVLWLDPADEAAPEPPPSLAGDRLVRLGTKADLAGGAAARDRHGPALAVSVRSGAGLDRLRGLLAERAAGALGSGSDPVITRARYRIALGQAVEALRRAGNPTLPLELRAEDLRRAGDALGSITGRVDVEDLLDVIFSQFCIGK